MEEGKLLRALARIAPGMVLRHVQKRAAAETILRSYYNAAGTGRTAEGWPTANSTAETTNRMGRDILRARGRDLERNTDMLPAEILALERNVIGTGMVLQAKVLGGEDEDEALNTQIEELWADWCRPKHCDITARQSFSELSCMAVRRTFVDGGLLVIKCYLNGHFYVQTREVDELDTTLQTHGVNRVIDGVEIDEYGRAAAYHIKVPDVYGWQVRSQRVSAERVIYLAPITRPGQIRELSPIAPSLMRIDDTNEFLSAALEKEKVLAFFAAFIKPGMEGSSFGGLGRGALGASGESTAPEMVLEQGTLQRLAPGEEVQTIAPSGTSSTAVELVRTTQRMTGSAAGLSYESVSRDLSQVNYSSARQGLLEDQRTYTMWQQLLISHLYDDIYAEWMDWVVLSGQLDIPDYWRRRKAYQRHTWFPNGWKWIDPLKESNANARALETDQTTLQDIAAGQGKDYRDVIRQRVRERKMQTELMGSGDVPPPGSSPNNK